MKVLLLSLVFLFAFNFVVVAQSGIKLEVGAKLPRKCADESDGYMATHPSQFRPFITKTIKNVRYSIAFEEESRKIRFIHTLDRKFHTANGLQVGSEITVTRSQLVVYPSWYIFAPATPDGWLPIVGSNLDDIFGGNSENSLSDLKDKETKTVKIGGFVKGGN